MGVGRPEGIGCVLMLASGVEDGVVWMVSSVDAGGRSWMSVKLSERGSWVCVLECGWYVSNGGRCGWLCRWRI